MLRENVRGHLRFLAKHHGVREAERARRLLRWSLAAARPRSSAASAAGCTATRPRWLASGRMPRAARPMSSLLRLALATGIVLAPGRRRRPRARLRGASATLAWALAIVFGALAVTFAVGGVA